MIQFSSIDNIILRNIIFENNTDINIGLSALVNITFSINVSISHFKIKDNQMNCKSFFYHNFI